MVTLAFSIFGLPDWWTGFAVGIVGLVVVVVIAFLVSEWWETRAIGDPGDWRDEMVHPDGRAEGGVLLCDFVDETNLGSIAKQKGLEPEPNRRERGSSTTRGGEVGAQGRGLSALLRRERQRDEREYFDIEKDPNAVLAAVLEQLERDGDLDRSIGHAPFIPLDARSVELLREVQQGGPADDLRERLIVVEKRRELEGIVERAPFVLIESEWQVVRVENIVSMRLLRLRPPYLAYDRYPPDADGVNPTAVPEGIQIQAQFTAGGLTAQGEGRLVHGATVRAGVLATIAGYGPEHGRLDLSPLAVFGRFGARRERPRYSC